MRKALVAAVSIGLILTAVGCGNKKEEAAGGTSAGTAPAAQQVNLRVAWWGGQARHDYTLKLIEMYEKLYPNVNIEAEYAGFDDYWKKLAPQAASNDLPDVIQMDMSYLSQYGGKGQLEDLTPYTTKGAIDVSSVNESIVSSGKLDGKLYALSLGSNAMAAIYDNEALKKAGVASISPTWTWDDFTQIAAKMKGQGLIFDHLRWDQFFPYFLRTQGAHLYNADGAQLGYTDDKLFSDYFKRYQDWYNAGYMRSLDKEAQSKGTPEENPVATGEGYMTIAFSNQFIPIQKAAKKPLMLAAVPGPNGTKGLYMKPSMFFSISKNSKNKEEAAKFINWFTNDIEANKIIKAERGIPISTKVQDALKPLLTPEETQVFDYVAWAAKNSSPIDPADPTGAAEVSKALKDAQDQLLYKKMSIEEAAAKFRKDANAVLIKNKK
ncbi:MAG: YesO [Paenibacillus sp.]|jgi:multiple sugar transport system substrate-binding protein|nr:YesO [Paenibacillus sp.]